MALDVLAHLLELLLGPLFLLLHLPELNVAVGDLIQILLLVLAGDVGAVVAGLLDGRFGVGTRTLSSLVGTLLWIALVAGAFGEFGDLGEVGEVLELFD